MSKMQYFSNKLSKIAKRWGLSAASTPLTFNIGDLSSVIWPNFWFFKLIITKSNSKK